MPDAHPETFALSRPGKDPAAIGGERCFVIAEAGVNHNGSAELAHALIDAAAEAGADAVKFQTFEAAALASSVAEKATYQKNDGAAAESQRDMLARLVLPKAEYPALKTHAETRGLIFLSTPFERASLAFLSSLDLVAFKVASGDVTNTPFLIDVARAGKPVLLSTGMSTLDEVDAAVRALAAAPALALFHCVSSYPALPEECNLRAIALMRKRFCLPVGWSDHTLGNEVSLAAVALGAQIIEKHLTLDHSLPGPDHRASALPMELAALVRGVRAVERALGVADKQPSAQERETARVARKSVHFARALPAGHVLGADDLCAMRPGTGISPARGHTLIGRRLDRAVAAGEMASEAVLAAHGDRRS